MKKIKLVDIKNAYQLEMVDNILVDQINSYPITIKDVNNTGSLEVQFPLLSKYYTQNSESLEESLKEIGFKKLNYRNGIATLLFNRKINIIDQYGELKRVLSTKLLGEMSQLPCPYCGQYGCDGLALKDELYVPIHLSCQKNHINLLDEIKEHGSLIDYLKGGLGAFVGALLPMALSLVLIIIANTSFGWLYIFSAMLAVQGYHYMKGPYGYKSLFITIFSVIVAFVIFLYSTCLYSLRDYISMLSFLESIEIVSSIIFSSRFIELFGFEALFFVVGLILVIISKPFSKKKVIEAHAKYDTLTKPII